MKILLNLLQEEKRRDIRKKIYQRFFLWQFILVFVLAVFYLSILASIYFILDFQLQGLESMGRQYDMAHSEQKKLDEYRKKFKETNALAETVNKIEKNHLSFTRIFVLLDEVLPESIALESLTTKEYTVLLSGRAATRDDLLSFEARLQASACVKNVDMPLNNLFSEKNVDFQMDFEMSKECLQPNIL